MSDVLDRALQTRLTEYNSAREEMLAAINGQHLVLTFGTASLVGGFAAGIVAFDQTFAPAVFLALAPLSWWMFLMWLGEVVRMLRSVAFCADRARDINALLSDPEAIRWETWRRASPHRTITWTYGSVLIMVGVTNAAAIITTILASHGNAHWSDWALWLSITPVVCVGLTVAAFALVTFRTWTVKGLGEGVGMREPSVFSALRAK